VAKRDRPRRARAALAWALAGFALLQLATAFALERLLPAVRDAEYADKLFRLRAALRAAPDRRLVLMLGSSRTLMSFQAGRVDAPDAVAFNFGIRGAGPMLDLVLLRRLLAEGIHPHLLLLEVLPPFLNQPGDRPLEEEWLQGSRLRVSEMGRLRRYHSHPPRLARQWLKMRWAPWAFYGRELRDWLVRGLPEPPPPPGDPEAGDLDAYGWQPYFENGVSPEQRERYWTIARNQYEPTFGPFRLAEKPARALEELLDLCERRGVPVALVLMPEGPAFRALYPPAMRRGLDDYLASVSRRRGLTVIDARAWLAEDDFWDGHHALPAGALTFTRRLEADGIRPLLRRGSGEGTGFISEGIAP
jgi:Protein of unknown function (DUF1574)